MVVNVRKTKIMANLAFSISTNNIFSTEIFRFFVDCSIFTRHSTKTPDRLNFRFDWFLRNFIYFRYSQRSTEAAELNFQLIKGRNAEKYLPEKVIIIVIVKIIFDIVKNFCIHDDRTAWKFKNFSFLNFFSL